MNDRAPSLIPRKVLFGNPSRIQPRLAPDASRLAYLAPDEGVLNVWVRTVGTADDRAVTRDRGRGIQAFFWAQDSQRIVFLQDRDGDENWHLWSVELASGVIRDLTPFLGVQAALVASDPDHPRELLVSLNVRDSRLKDVYRLDLDTGALLLEAENPGAAVGWHIDPAFQVRAREDALPDGGFALHVRERDGGWREVSRWSHDETTHALGITPDGEGVYLLDSRDRDTAGLVRLELASGKTTLLAADEQYDIEGALAHPRTRAIQLAFWDKDRREYQVLDETIAEDWQSAAQLDDGDVSLVSRDSDDGLWLLAFVRDRGPIRYHLFDRASKQAEFLFSHRDELERLELASTEPMRLTSRDGWPLRGYLTLPPGLDRCPLPLIVYPHGGPWVRDTWGFDPIVQWLANRGYAVLQINFRGSTGFGKRFLHAGDKEWGRKMQHDLTDAVQWAITERIADPQRIAIMGGSYGGYAALAGITFTPDLYAAAVSIVGPSSLFTLIASIPPYWEPVKQKFMLQVGDPDSDAEMLRERSPLFHVERIQTPLLIGQGANDPRVKQHESEQIVEAMRTSEKQVGYVLFPDEGHGFARPENRLQFFGHVEKFLARHLGGRCEPLPEDQHGGSGIER